MAHWIHKKGTHKFCRPRLALSSLIHFQLGRHYIRLCACGKGAILSELGLGATGVILFAHKTVRTKGHGRTIVAWPVNGLHGRVKPSCYSSSNFPTTIFRQPGSLGTAPYLRVTAPGRRSAYSLEYKVDKSIRNDTTPDRIHLLEQEVMWLQWLPNVMQMW